MKFVPSRIKEAREAKRWTQEELARRINSSRPTINRWETGRVSPKEESLRAIAAATGKPLDWFYDREGLTEIERENARLRAENEHLRTQLQQKEKPASAQETGSSDEEERRRLSYEGLLKAGASPDTSGRRISLPEPVTLALLRGVRLKVMGEATITLNILAEGPDEHVVRDLLEILGPNPGGRKDPEKAEG